jgi:glutathione S-transferase
MILYGLPFSSPCNKVRFLLHLLGLHYDLHTLDLFAGEGQKPEFLRLNPTGKIPALDDGGFFVFESNAILRYLARKTGSAVYPSEARACAVVDEWMDLTSLYVNDGVSRVFYNRVIGPLRKMESNEVMVQDGFATLARFLPIVEGRLATSAYLGGPELTIADLNLLATLEPVEAAGVDITPYPAIQRWRDDLRTRDFYTRCHKDYLAAVAPLGVKAWGQ